MATFEQAESVANSLPPVIAGAPVTATDVRWIGFAAGFGVRVVLAGEPGDRATLPGDVHGVRVEFQVVA